MYSGLGRLPLYPFVATGFAIVMVAGLGLALVYVVGALLGKRVALIHVKGCLGLLVIGGAADIVWASVSGQWAGFQREIGLASLFEMLVLGMMFLATMWFMAHRYLQGKTD